jgi:hypothetical protein
MAAPWAVWRQTLRRLPRCWAYDGNVRARDFLARHISRWVWLSVGPPPILPGAPLPLACNRCYKTQKARLYGTFHQ